MKEWSCKPNNTWVDKGSEFYNTSLKSWLTDDDIEIHSTYNKDKLVVVERLIRKLKEWNLQIYDKNIENMCIFKLFALVDDYNNAIHKTISKLSLLILVLTHIWILTLMLIQKT